MTTKTMFMCLVILFIAVLAACEPVDSGEVYVEDNSLTVYFVHFSILCDTDIEMGMVQSWAVTDNGAESSDFIGGVMSDEQYERLCERAKIK